MANQKLNFTQEGSKYKASFVSAGTTVVQLEREYKAENNIGQLTVYAYIDGMNPVPVRNWTSYEASRNMIFQIDIPSGVTIEIVSLCSVINANIITEG
ncbi:hypothetical protein [uncultured Mediterranea sp.]|uniref:hypothetical protein n=1 Tax=uncultured Mediterranea sp. TaxID=1926662 RepID=UPI0027D95E02|nr:hypothetical protein [uncultured Mediterranea sp.]